MTKILMLGIIDPRRLRDPIADEHGSQQKPMIGQGAGMPVIVQTVLLLIASNVFMTFAWYAHLKEMNHKPWLIAALFSWGLALFEYLFQVPANRIGHTQMSVGQLKIIQEVITLSVFVPFSVWYLREPIKLDYLWAGLCLCGAVYFVFRGGMGTGQ